MQHPNPTPAVSLPPQNIEAEMAVLGAMLLLDEGRTAEAIEILVAEDFYREAHAQIFRAMRSIVGRAESLDIVTLKDELVRNGEIEQSGGYVYLMQLAEYVPTPSNIAYYAKIVRELATLRRLQDLSRTLYKSAGGDSTANDLIADMERRIEELRPKEERPLTHGLRSLLIAQSDAMNERYHAGNPLRGIATGFDALDWPLSGMQRGDLIIVAARPSMGKTVLAINIATSVAKRQLVSVVFSIEMGAMSITDRVLCAEAGVNSDIMRSGKFSDADYNAVEEARTRLWDAPMVVDENAGATPGYIRAKCKKVAAEYGGIDLVVVDYLQLMTMGSSRETKSDNRTAEIGAISSALKKIARDFDVPLIAVAQLSRAVELRADKRPMLSDLRDSGNIEQDADEVLFLYRPAYYEAKAAMQRGEKVETGGIDQAEVIIAKQRNGPTGSVNLNFQGEYFRFTDIAKGEPQW